MDKEQELGQTYDVLCAWCIDTRTVIGQSPVRGSHGICRECKRSWLASAARARQFANHITCQHCKREARTDRTPPW